MKILKLVLSLVMLGALAGTVRAGGMDEVTAAATAYFNAQNAHDIGTVSAMLADTPDLLVIRGPSVSWGKDAAVQQYAALYKGIWKLGTDGKPPKVVMVGETAAETFVPVHFTVGPKEGETK